LLFQKTVQEVSFGGEAVILAEMAMPAGLTRHAGFPMMKVPSLAAGRWSLAFAERTRSSQVARLANDWRRPACDGFPYAHRLP
jgi:hypothetical protein